jgi:predicted HTH transcriptional regulator
MPDDAARLTELVTRGREDRSLEYKGTRGREPFAWGPDTVNAKIARTAMAMANIGGGAIVVGMDQTGPDSWEPNGIDEATDRTYQQDRVQQYVNRRASPYVELVLHHFSLEGRRFVIIEVAAFRELPIVCRAGSGSLRQGATYTRSFEKHETVEIQSESEMREMLDRAIAVGIEKWLRPVFAAMRDAGVIASLGPTDADRFRVERGDL